MLKSKLCFLIKTTVRQESKLPAPVKSLMELIFDEKRMNDAIVEMKYDVQKLPLGKLTAEQIKGALVF